MGAKVRTTGRRSPKAERLMSFTGERPTQCGHMMARDQSPRREGTGAQRSLCGRCENGMVGRQGEVGTPASSLLWEETFFSNGFRLGCRPPDASSIMQGGERKTPNDR